VFGQQYEGKKIGRPERNASGHTPARFKRTCLGSNGIFECTFLSENAHRTVHSSPGSNVFKQKLANISVGPGPPGSSLNAASSSSNPLPGSLFHDHSGCAQGPARVAGAAGSDETNVTVSNIPDSNRIVKYLAFGHTPNVMVEVNRTHSPASKIVALLEASPTKSEICGVVVCVVV
jgi:hypothetical protein